MEEVCLRKLRKEGPTFAARIEGEIARRKISLTNDFAQAGEKYRSLSKMDREHLIDNLIADLMHIDKPIPKRVIENLTKADKNLGKAVADGLNLTQREPEKTAAASRSH